MRLLHQLEQSPSLEAICRVVLLVAVPLFLTGAAVNLPIAFQALLAWGAIALAVSLQRLLHNRPLFLSIFLSLVTLFFLARYLLFRIEHTLISTGPLEFTFVLALFFAELYGMVIQTMGLFVNVKPLHRPLEPVPLNHPQLPTVDVLIPTYNEPEQMVAITASACTLFDYPKDKLHIYILDDGGTLQKRMDPSPDKAEQAQLRHETLKSLADFLEIHYRTRNVNYSAKAGNLNEALYGDQEGQENPHGDLVLVLDCDHVPTRDLLRNTAGYFIHDPKLFLVQTPHFFINPDPIEKNLGTFNKIPGDNVMFYGKVMPGLDFWNTAFFCGSAAILRRSCLDEIGGITGETITEDAETALNLHSRGYNSAYVEKPMICGLCPETFEDFIVQRNRWAQGMIQIFLLKNPLFRKGLNLQQRICYLNSCSFWLFSFSRFIFMITPFLFIYCNLHIYHVTIHQCLIYPIPHMILSTLLSNQMHGDVRHPFFSELYETVMAFFNLPAIISVIINPRSPQFKVTPKDTSLETDTVSHLAPPFYILLLLSLFMYPVAINKLLFNPQMWGSITICLCWGSFNLLILMLCMGVLWERRQVRKKHRMPVEEKIRVQMEGSDLWIDAVTTDLSEEGLGFFVPGTLCFSRGDVLKIETREQSGRRYVFTAEVVQVKTKRTYLHLGCKYLYVDEESFLNITNYFYGESDRWQRLWKMRMNKVSIREGIIHILQLGFRGTYQHGKGLCVMMVHRLTKQRLWAFQGIRAMFGKP